MLIMGKAIARTLGYQPEIQLVFQNEISHSSDYQNEHLAEETRAMTTMGQ